MSVDLRTRYLGQELSSPIVASAGPVTGTVEGLRRLEDAGAAAVVLPSLSEEEIAEESRRVHALMSQGTHAFGEAMTYLPEPALAVGGADQHLALVAEAKAHLSIPVIASLDGVSHGGWVRYAGLLADAGADAIELHATAFAADRFDTAVTVEGALVDLVRAVRAATEVPLAVKIGPTFTAITHVVHELDAAGADAVVCFDRCAQPDLDLESLEVVHVLTLSTSDDLLVPLRWIAILRGQVGCELALSGGVHSGTDVVKAVLAGADAVMTTSALCREGPEHVGVLRGGLEGWLDEHGYESVTQARGSLAQEAVPDPQAYEHAGYAPAPRANWRHFPASGARN